MSYYLDDMNLRTGDKVRAKATIGSLGLTAGKVYTVERRDCGCISGWPAGVINDRGRWVIPSARFDRVGSEA